MPTPTAPIIAEFAPLFGHDLSTVRLHLSEAPRAFGARAFTVGEEIHVDPAHFDPGTRAGRHLIAHEITHVLQQRAGRTPSVCGRAALEREADMVGARVSRGVPVLLPVGSGEPALAVQFDLVADSIAADMPTLVGLEGGDVNTAAAGTVGLTTDPANPRASAWTIAVTQSGEAPNVRYFRQLTVTQTPLQGTNTSHYLRAGIHETNLALDMEAYAEDHNVRQCLRPFEGYGDDRVYFYLSPAIAARNHDAEVEHCDDHLYAYNNSLGPAHTVLTTAAARGKVGPFTSADIATTSLISELTLALPAALQGVAFTSAAWLGEYMRLCGESMRRDQANYHTFGLELMDARPEGAITYLTGAARDGDDVTPRFVRLTNGTTDIGTRGSDQFIR